jgi:hypothetical protein
MHARLIVSIGFALVALAVLGGFTSRGSDGDDTPKIALRFHAEPDKRVKAATMRFGISLPGLKSPNKPKEDKKLTWDPQGITSTVCLKIDGEEILFGYPPGTWKEKEGELRGGMRSVWQLPGKKLIITQAVTIGRGTQTFAVDTCHVRYTIENQDDKPHQVGLRFLLDTFIGTNDGAPFIIPGESQLCDTMKEFSSDKIPEFVQALESMDFKKPGVIAHLRLKAGGGLEPPGRVAFTSWPDPLLKVPGADAWMTKWKVPLVSIQDSMDSAAVLYWDEKEIPAGGKRTLGFTYGLGNFSANAARNLGLILAGDFQVNSDVTVLALVKGAEAKDTLTLHVTDGLARSQGTETQTVPAAKGEAKVSPVTWKVRPLRAGTFAVGIESSTGAFHHQGMRINKRKLTNDN